MTRDTVKGFIFGAVLMLMTPALALPGKPQTANLNEVFSEEATAQQPPNSAATQYFRLSYKDAEDAIAQALSERGAGAKLSAIITSNHTEDYLFSYDQPIAVEIRSLNFDANTSRFTANLVSVSNNKVLAAKAISGRFNEMVEVPVLRRNMRAGETIAQSDIEFKDYAQARARVDTITDVASLIGKSPERVITAGRPIRAQEIAQPTVVKKNDTVKMVYNQGGMSITTSGQAMSDGSKGHVISVKNIASKKIVQATVQDESTVLINNGGVQTSSLNNGGVYAD